MNPDRKPRADAALKTLPADTQAGIADYARTHTLRATAAWLTSQGVPAAYHQVSRFLQWHTTRQQKKSLGTWEALREELQRSHPLVNDHELNALGLRHFALNAIQNDDLRGFVALHKLALAREIYEFNTASQNSPGPRPSSGAAT